MNIVDLVVLALVGIAAMRGWRKGLLGQVFEFGGGLLGLAAGVAFGDDVARLVTQHAGLQAALIALVFIFVSLSLGQTFGFVIGYRFGRIAHRARLGVLESGLGAGFAVAVTIVVFWLVASLLVSGPSRSVARALARSSILDVVSSTLPQPPDVLGAIRQYLETSGFPQVFAGMPRPIGPPVDLPPGRVARRAARAADASTVRIVAPACGGTQVGSGFVVARSHVATNAHVVAGSERVTVQDAAGDRPGTVVLFDPATDVAIVRVQTALAGPPLSLVTDELDRGTPGATLGYPGEAGAELVVKRAAVQAQFTATGRDIYGRRTVQRDVYELRAGVRQGDSGGPFVLPSGAVAGMTFAASSTDANTGYALTGDEIEDEIEVGVGRAQAVSTNGCTR